MAALTPPDIDNQQSQKEYFDALTESLKVLENRKGPNLFNVAAAFFNPGRTGSFGEALGNAAGAMGADQERDELRAPQIAQMRAALAGQKYDVQKKAKAYELIANAMNLGSPEAAQQALQTGNGLFGIGNKFTPELYFAISRYDPKIAETVKNAAGMDIERYKALIEATKMNMSIAQMYDQFGKDVTDRFITLQGGRPPASGAPSAPASTPPATSSTAPEPKPYTGSAEGIPAVEDPEEVRKQAEIDALKKESRVQPPAAPAASQTGVQQFGYEEIEPNKFRLKYSGRVFSVPPNSSPAAARKFIEDALAAEQDIYKKTVEAEAKPFEKKVEDILNFDNTATAVNLDRVDKILTIVQKNPRITGILQQTDNASGLGKYLMALGAAAQEGIQAGKFGQFSLPIEKFINTANMTEDQKAALGELTRLISQEFLAGMRANRGLLGVNPTDNDARLFQAAAENPTSLARNIYSWAQGRAAEYESMNDIYKGYSRFRTERGRGVDPALFFMDESSPYHAGIRSYTERLLKVKENTPGMR
jgi:hypothetical protein